MNDRITLNSFHRYFVWLMLFSASITFSQVVTSSADDGSDGTLRVEIMENAAVTFSPSVTNIMLAQGPIMISSDLVLSGNVATPVTINGSGAQIFNISGGAVTINDLSLTNGVAEDGGAIYLKDAALTLNAVTIRSSVANGDSGSGGAIFVDTGATLSATSSAFTGNRANRAGGAIEGAFGSGDGITLTNCSFSGNIAGSAPATPAPGNGGAIHITGGGNTTITGGSFSNNKAANFITKCD